jgi:hypothetical protein
MNEDADTEIPKWLSKILCFFGWHYWTWKFEDGDTIWLDKEPPDHAICCCCKKPYK